MLTQARLKELLNYNPATGVFTRLVRTSNRIKAGDIAGCKSPDGYLRICVDRKQYLAHRLAWLYIHSEFPENDIDHINHQRYDNRIFNLRSVSHKENIRNLSMHKNNTSGFIGIHWNKNANKWQSYIMIDGKNKHLGYFKDKKKALKARHEAEIQLGFHKNHGKYKCPKIELLALMESAKCNNMLVIECAKLFDKAVAK